MQSLSIDLTKPVPPVMSGHLKMGGTNPRGVEINVNNRHLTLDGKPWLPVMGEFHFSRYPRAQWEEEILKMKAGGIDIVSTYIFWIHHEEERRAMGLVRRQGSAGIRAALRKTRAASFPATRAVGARRSAQRWPARLAFEKVRQGRAQERRALHDLCARALFADRKTTSRPALERRRHGDRRATGERTHQRRRTHPDVEKSRARTRHRRAALHDDRLDECAGARGRSAADVRRVPRCVLDQGRDRTGIAARGGSINFISIATTRRSDSTSSKRRAAATLQKPLREILSRRARPAAACRSPTRDAL